MQIRGQPAYRRGGGYLYFSHGISLTEIIQIYGKNKKESP
jgi:hypothetical protein